jgi:hypothetical protein
MTKIRVDMSLLSGHDFIAIEEATGKPLSEALQSTAGIYAAAWRIHQRDDPTFTYEQTLDLNMMRDFEIVNQDAEGEASAAGNGDRLSVSPVFGG